MENKDLEVVDTTQMIINENLKEPGDKLTQEIKPGGDVITKLNTKEKKATHRQYKKKDGTLGKQTIIIMQPDQDE